MIMLADPPRRPALILAAHATEGGGRRREPVWRWARFIARRNLFSGVAVGYVSGASELNSVLAQEANAIRVVVLFLMAEGWFARRRVPPTCTPPAKAR